MDDQTTGLPLLRSWGAVYLLVIGTFTGYVAAMLILQRFFS
jgi:hypothetical protein